MSSIPRLCNLNALPQGSSTLRHFRLKTLASYGNSYSSLLTQLGLKVKAHKADKRPPSPVSPPRDVKRIRIEGGRAPAPKRILAELNSDDELIVRMKGERFTDKQIAARLREEGRVDYHYKTISSRWVRLKRALEQKQDQDLDDQLTDWHEGDVGHSPVLPSEYADL